MLQDTVSALSKSLTVPFALAVGLSSVVSLSGLVTTVGLAEIVACSIAMSGYLAGQTEALRRRAGPRTPRNRGVARRGASESTGDARGDGPFP